MKEKDLDNWWVGLSVPEKERIASKYQSKKSGVSIEIKYPNCTNIWNFMDVKEKEYIKKHVTDDHGVLLKEFTEGQSYSY